MHRTSVLSCAFCVRHHFAWDLLRDTSQILAAIGDEMAYVPAGIEGRLANSRACAIAVRE